MNKHELQQFIDRAEQEALVRKQPDYWGANVTQTEIFDAGVREMTYRLKRILDVLDPPTK